MVLGGTIVKSIRYWETQETRNFDGIARDTCYASSQQKKKREYNLPRETWEQNDIFLPSSVQIMRFMYKHNNRPF